MLEKVPAKASESSKPARARQPTPASPHALLQLQQKIGNRAFSGLVQTKLRVGRPGDVLEQEADRVAERVMRVTAGDGGIGNQAALRLLGRERAVRSDAQPTTEPSFEAPDVLVQAKADGPTDAPVSVQQALEGGTDSGVTMRPGLRSAMESAFAADFSGIRIHTGASAARLNRDLNAHAFTVGQDIFFNAGEYRPDTSGGRRLLAHELTHVLQQSGGSRAARNGEGGAPRSLEAGAIPGVIQRDDIPIQVLIVGQLDRYTVPGTGETYQVGDAAGPSILMQIEGLSNGATAFRWFNFAAGESAEGTSADWSMRTFVSGMFPNRDFIALGRQLTPADWRRLWPNPLPALLDLHERKIINLPDSVILTGYKGMIFQESLRSLADNEHQVDALLAAPDRVQRLQDYATSLREAGLVRDALQARLDQIKQSRAQAHSFTFGIAGNIINTDPARQMQLAREQGEAEQMLQFWIGIFPLLSRLQTSEIRSTRVEDELRGIKASITSTRAELMRAQVDGGSFDLMDLDVVRARLQSQLGPRASAVIAAEDKSRSRSKLIGGAALFALSIGLLFLPGGVFIDAAIGVAMAGVAVDRAIALGNAANTGLNLEEGLASQATANAAIFEAVVSVAAAALGVAVAGFRIFRFASALKSVRAATSGLELGSQVKIAQALVARPEFARALRSTGELQELVQRFGLRLTAAELQGLRQTIYQIRGVAALGSRQRLQSFLDLVWANRQTIRTGDDVYRLYSRVAGNAPLTRSETAYLADIASLARSRPAGAASHIQNVTRLAEGVDEISAEVARAATNPDVLAGIRNRFFMFFRAGTVRGGRIIAPVGERIYLNVVADRATEVLDALVRRVVDHPQEFPGVVAAKLTGPAGVVRRADAIVVYMENQAASSKVLNWMREYQAANPSYFQAATPQITEPVLSGVSVGAEPVASAGGASFGGLRSDLIARALTDAGQRGLTREQFGALVDQLFRGAKINPDLPHTNLP
jgi:Domain of unknown function (DUF4157)/HopA1 effector protein family